MIVAAMLVNLLLGAKPAPSAPRYVTYEAACGRKDRRALDPEWREVLRIIGSKKPDALEALKRISVNGEGKPAKLLAAGAVMFWNGGLQTYVSPTPLALNFERLTAAEQQALSPRMPGQPQVVSVAVDVDVSGLARKVELGGQGKSIDEFERLSACKAWNTLYLPMRNESGFADGSIVLTVRVELR